MDWKKDTWPWLLKLSHSLSGGAEAGHSTTGHAGHNVNGTVGALVFMSLILLVLSTMYMAFRVYYQKKKLTPKLRKELNVVDSDAEEEDAGFSVDIGVAGEPEIEEFSQASELKEQNMRRESTAAERQAAKRQAMAKFEKEQLKQQQEEAQRR